MGGDRLAGMHGIGVDELGAAADSLTGANHTLEINLNGGVWTKMGSMVAYVGNIKFTREGILEHGIGKRRDLSALDAPQ